mmetsp:Transcript_8105/g.20475  ORF Transcript_8105/g.20475 Transcript_8105/m.20475 type:complete len:411 (+) Transcript_8105:239-1471(+)
MLLTSACLTYTVCYHHRYHLRPPRVSPRSLGNPSFLRSNIFSSACMFTSVSPTSLASVPSLRSACMGPCSSLFTMLLLSSSTALSCFFVSPSPNLVIALSSSLARMSSALLRNRLMVGTVSSESRHASKDACSSLSITAASSAARSRAPLFNSTSSFRSSTLYTMVLGSSPQLASTLRGTAMSTSRRWRPTGSPAGAIPARSSLVMMMPVDAAVKITSCDAASVLKSSMSAILMFTSGKSAASSSTRPRLRLTMVISVQRLDARCLTSRRLMVPAPTIITLHPSNEFPGSFICTSSAAADDTDTAPLAMLVSLRTRLPAVIAALKRPLRWRPKPSTCSPSANTFLTCARICPSPITTESSPPDTLSRCPVASWSRSRNRCSRSSSSGMPLYWLIHSSTSRTPRCQLSATT